MNIFFSMLGFFLPEEFLFGRIAYHQSAIFFCFSYIYKDDKYSRLVFPGSFLLVMNELKIKIYEENLYRNCFKT